MSHIGLDVPGLAGRHGIVLRGVVHIGAHTGQEFARYEQAGIRQQVWVEPQPGPFAQLRAAIPDEPRIRLFNVACGSVRTTATMHHIEGNRGLSDSLLPPDHALMGQRWRDRTFTPGGTFEVPVVPIDDLLAVSNADPTLYNFLSIDTQGYELEVLRGATEALTTADAVLLEVSFRELYAGQPLAHELIAFLGDRGFRIADVCSYAQGADGSLEQSDMLFLRSNRR
jgi:FkbM family methyltransferase